MHETKFKITKYTNEYKLVDETLVDAKTVVTSFVTFRSMEGASRAEKIKRKSTGPLSRLIDFAIGEHDTGFLKSGLVIHRAVGPDLIKWENLGVTQF